MSVLPSIVQYPAVRWAAGGWSLFIAENALLSENRTWLIDAMGEERYHWAYGTCSTIATASIGYAYYSIRKLASTTTLPQPLVIGRGPISLLSVSTAGGCFFLSIGAVMASQAAPKMQIPFAFVDPPTKTRNSSTEHVSSSNSIASKSFQVRCPFDFSDKRTSQEQDGSVSSLQGLERVSRHPGLWSFGLLGLGQACLATTVPHRIWWCGPAAVAWLGGWHTDSRFRRGMGGTLSPEYESHTSNIPFTAMITGRQGSGSWKALMDDIKPLNAAVAIGATFLWVLRRVAR